MRRNTQVPSLSSLSKFDLEAFFSKRFKDLLQFALDLVSGVKTATIELYVHFEVRGRTRVLNLANRMCAKVIT